MKCGGSANTGRVPLKNILQFFDGKPPSTSGRITKVGLDKILAILAEEREASPSIAPPKGTKDIWGFAKFILASTLLQKKMKSEVLGQ